MTLFPLPAVRGDAGIEYMAPSISKIPGERYQWQALYPIDKKMTYSSSIP